MIVFVRPLDDCMITVGDVTMLAVYESQKKYEDCPLLNVSCQRIDGNIIHYEDICDLEVF